MPFIPNRCKTLTTKMAKGNFTISEKNEAQNGMAPISDLQSDAGALGWDGGLEMFPRGC